MTETSDRQKTLIVDGHPIAYSEVAWHRTVDETREPPVHGWTVVIDPEDTGESDVMFAANVTNQSRSIYVTTDPGFDDE